MFDSGSQERTIPATPRRLAEARQRGLVPQSRELTSAAVGFAAAAGLWLLGPPIWMSAVELFAAAWSAPAVTMDDVREATSIGVATSRMAVLLAGLLAIPAVTAVLVSLLQQGFRPQLRRPPLAWSLLNPMACWRRMARDAGPFGIGQMLAKIVVVCVVAALASVRMERVATGEVAAAGFGFAAAIGRVIVDSGVLLTAGLLLVSTADWIRCRRRFLLSLRMTATEARDEARHSNRRARPRTRTVRRVSLLQAQQPTSDAEAARSSSDSWASAHQLPSDLLVE